MQRKQAAQFIKQVLHESQGALSAELVENPPKPKKQRATCEAKQVYRVKVTHRQHNRCIIIGKQLEWPPIRQAWNELERSL